MTPKSPKISIYASAAKPNHWMDLYNSIGENDIDFEIVFVGPNKPNFPLPDNFRFIQSFVKPSQSWEIACRNTTGDYVMAIADDCEFRTPRPLDRLFSCYKSHDSELLIVSSKLMTNGQDHSAWAQRYYSHDQDSPVMPLCGLMSRKLHFALGGIDRNFIAIMWDLDIAMRVHALGGNVVMADVYVDENKEKKSGIRNLTPDFWNHGRALLDGLWAKDGKVHFNRVLPVQSFSDINLLEVSQGARGRWRGHGPIWLEKTEDRITRFRAIARNARRLLSKPSMYPTYIRRLYLRLRPR